MHTPATPANNATNGPGVTFQAQNGLPPIMHTPATPENNSTNGPVAELLWPNTTRPYNLQQHTSTAIPGNATIGIPFCSMDSKPRLSLMQCHITIRERVAGVQDSQHHQVTLPQNELCRHHLRALFSIAADAWKEGLRPAAGQLTRFTGNSLWPLGIIHLPLTLTGQDKTRRRTTLVDFVVIRHPSEHNVILGRTALLKSRAISSTIHGIVKFITNQGLGTILATPPI
ncbi:unnamed protein product [Lactuca saligna]|uniref:Uncharacterized protein n=1 Tax=Lactuca saligna TaxID=75948 RepID=A0AA36EBZ5_LACSI|nr:unnamed protein product [Lactuca saligna]